MAKKKETIQPTEDTIKKNPEAANVKSNEDTTQKIADLTAEKETLQAENKKQAEEIQELCQMLADKDRPEYLVVIPYKASEPQGNELYLAIRGWLKHFKERFRIVIVGDKPGDWNHGLPENVSEIAHLPHICQTANPPLDIVAKLQEVIAAYPEYPGFILTNDDIYPVNDFDITEVKLLKSDGPLTDRKSTGNLYAENRTKTLKLLQAEQRSVYDYGCHTPVYLEAAKFLELVEKFNLTESAYLITSLYFNYFYPNRIPIKLELEYDNLKAGVYRQNANLARLREIKSRKIWINNSVSGWSDQFAAIIANLI